MYKQTSKRHSSLLSEMAKKLQYSLKLQHATRIHHIEPYLRRRPAEGSAQHYGETEYWRAQSKSSAITLDFSSPDALRRYGLSPRRAQSVFVGPSL